MNLSTSTSSSCQRPEPSRPESGSPADRNRCADDFQRLLRDKGGSRDTERDDAGAGAGEQQALLQPAPAHAGAAHPAAPAATLATLRPAEVVAATPGLRTESIEAMAAAQARMELSAPVDPVAARRFDVMFNEPAGLSLSMRAVQPAADAGRWALSVSSADLNPSVLRRNTGRLEERLRSRALSSEPVRIEHDDDDVT